MIKGIRVNKFKAVPYLEETLLMQNHSKFINFAVDKPNIIVGPNGAGKSALLKALSFLTLSNMSGQSAFDSKYLEYSPQVLWHKDWGKLDGFEHLNGWVYQYLPGLEAAGDNGSAFYYRPRHIPGNETSTTHALMCGYSDEAREYSDKTKNKSCGQKSQALLDRIMKVMRGEEAMPGFVFQNWSGFPEKPHTPEKLKEPYYSTSHEHRQVNVLLKRFKNSQRKKPVILMDEPEQSLDALAQAVLWKSICEADCSKMQLIVATHSVYPLLFPERFNLIEAVPGYAEQVRSLFTQKEEVPS